MTDIVRFYKKDGKWYADVPNHTLEECEMVYGTDTFFNLHTTNDDTKLIVEFSDEEPSFVSDEVHMYLKGDYGDEGGALYTVYDRSVAKPYELSLCKVVFDFFGKFPAKIYILNIYNSVKSALMNQCDDLSPISKRDWELRRNIEHLRSMIDFPQIDELKDNYFILDDGLIIHGGRFIEKEQNEYHYILFYKGFRFIKGEEFAIRNRSCVFIEYEDILNEKIDLKIITEGEYQAAFDKYFKMSQETMDKDIADSEEDE